MQDQNLSNAARRGWDVSLVRQGVLSRVPGTHNSCVGVKNTKQRRGSQRTFIEELKHITESHYR